MLSFDATTLAAYRAGSTPQGKAQGISDSLGSGTLTVELRDGATDGTGKLEIDVPIVYSGMSLMIHVENVGSDMVTTGKVHGAQVALVA